MTHNGSLRPTSTTLLEMQGDPASYPNFDTQADELKKLRDAIEDAETPEGIIDAIEAMNTAFDARDVSARGPQPALPVEHEQRRPAGL